LTDKNKELAQRYALLESELGEFKKHCISSDKPPSGELGTPIRMK
jgi:hypothetical protein